MMDSFRFLPLLEKEWISIGWLILGNDMERPEEILKIGSCKCSLTNSDNLSTRGTETGANDLSPRKVKGGFGEPV
jgi:hypothetical protein